MALQKLTLSAIDNTLRGRNGNPYVETPDVAGWIHYVLGGRSLSEFVEFATLGELEDVHILITAKVYDGTLRLREDEKGAMLIAHCAIAVANRLAEMTGCEFRPFLYN